MKSNDKFKDKALFVILFVDITVAIYISIFIDIPIDDIINKAFFCIIIPIFCGIIAYLYYAATEIRIAANSNKKINDIISIYLVVISTLILFIFLSRIIGLLKQTGIDLDNISTFLAIILSIDKIYNNIKESE